MTPFVVRAPSGLCSEGELTSIDMALSVDARRLFV